ncbi:MAG: CcoQ/FixQ family Cbb3-type cytochrome c oxidase assembly chaperone [Phycisphaeraceae bacterium]|nr:CcoQ/FixQ family Cbb3-type cytochrome c oxidase assembly chaperone [Phycisphaeraceae bacterium]
MRMSDVMSGLGLAAFPIAAMALFLLVFVGVIWQVLRKSARAEFDRAAMLPLSDSGESDPAEAKEQIR